MIVLHFPIWTNNCAIVVEIAMSHRTFRVPEFLVDSTFRWCWCLIDMEGPSRRDVITMDSTTLIRQSIWCKLLSMITGEESTMHLRTSMKRYPIASPMKYKADSWNARWLVPWSYQEATCANLRRRTTITWLPITAGSISLSGSMHSGQSSHYYHLWTPDQRIPVARDGCAREPGSSVNSDPATMEFARGWTLTTRDVVESWRVCQPQIPVCSYR